MPCFSLHPPTNTEEHREKVRVDVKKKPTSGYFTPAWRHSKQFLLRAHHSYLFLKIFKVESILFMLVVPFSDSLSHNFNKKNVVLKDRKRISLIIMSAVSD